MITFHSFLQSIRKQKHVDLDTLGMGICSSSFLSRVERGDRKAPYLLKECLLGRLGVSSDNFYKYLQPREYEAWHLRQEIARNFLFEQINEAKKNIGKYSDLFSSDDVISKQFSLYVHAEYLAITDGNSANILALYKEATECSMSHLINDFEKNIDSALLSILEYCVLVKYISTELFAVKSIDTTSAQVFLSRLAMIMDKVENDTSDGDIAAKIYSMAVVSFSKGIRKYFPDDEAYSFDEKVRCFKAVEFLRESGKTYYLSEIIGALKTNKHINRREEQYEAELAQYFDVIKEVYETANLSMSSCNSNSAYILVESGAYAIGEVLLKRRKMLKLSQKDLCKDICTEKTMTRMENGKCAVQDIIFKNLCERLKLVPDYIHGEIVYDELNTYDLYRQVKEADNSNNAEELRNGLKRLKEKMNMDVLSNKQCWARAFNNLRRENKEISDEEYCDNITKLLMLSVGNIDEIDPKCVCFTDAEIMLLQNLAIRCKESKKKYLNLIIPKLNDSDKDIKLLMHYRINAFLLSFYASELGNEGLYAVSNSISDRILETGLRVNNLLYISDNIYNKYWNAKQSESHNPSDLDQCIALSKFMKDQRDVTFYASKK